VIVGKLDESKCNIRALLFRLSLLDVKSYFFWFSQLLIASGLKSYPLASIVRTLEVSGDICNEKLMLI
jgi:hypothetical protein